MLTLSKEGEKLDIDLFEQVRAGAAGFCGMNLCWEKGCGTLNNDTNFNFSVDYKLWWAGISPDG